jgi:transcriptional regulator with XRE-family HTH domain
MEIPMLIRRRLKELGLEQKDLAAAAQVTESYISQLLAGRKAPPAPERTVIYERIGAFLKLPAGELSRLAAIQRSEELRRKIAERPKPLFPLLRDLVLAKCDEQLREEIRKIVGNHPFGELERLVACKLLDTSKRAAAEGIRSHQWIERLGAISGMGAKVVGNMIAGFLEADLYRGTLEQSIAFLEAMIHRWSIDLTTFALQIDLDSRLVSQPHRAFEFVERQGYTSPAIEPGFQQFLLDKSLSGTASIDELEFLASLRFGPRRPTPLYYYRELQSIRDQLHFSSGRTIAPSRAQ